MSFTLESLFVGSTAGEGVFTNSWTRSERCFRVDIVGTWDGRVLTLREDFAYDDGEKDHKTWRFEKKAPGVYDGQREDVVGVARVWTEGAAVRLEYAVKLGGVVLDFTDTLELRLDGSVLNRARVSKWGVPIGRVELTMRPLRAAPQTSP